eukprot:1160538-Pelagomonas_calceolata.AAC.1
MNVHAHAHTYTHVHSTGPAAELTDLKTSWLLRRLERSILPFACSIRRDVPASVNLLSFFRHHEVQLTSCSPAAAAAAVAAAAAAAAAFTVPIYLSANLSPALAAFLLQPILLPIRRQELVGWEVCLLRSRTPIGSVTEVLMAGGGTLKEDDEADAPEHTISSNSSRSSRTKSKAGGHKQEYRLDNRSTAAAEREQGDVQQVFRSNTEQDLPMGMLLRVERHANLQPFQFQDHEADVIFYLAASGIRVKCPKWTKAWNC